MTPSKELAHARRAFNRRAPLDRVVRALRLALASELSDADAAEARRLLLLSRVRWFQLAHIASDILTRVDGHTKVFASLKRELTAPLDGPLKIERPSRASPRKAGMKRLSFVTDLIADGPGVVRATEVKKLLLGQIKGLAGAQSGHPEDQALFAAARRYIEIEAAWRYHREWRGAPSRVRQLLAFARRPDAGGLRESAWLALRLGFGLALSRPVFPRRALLEAISVVLGEDIAITRDSRQALLLRLGGGEGDTPPERLWNAWHGARKRVETALDETGAAPASGMARHWWRALAGHLRLDATPSSPSAEALYTLGVAVRGDAVAGWLRSMDVPPLTNDRALDRLEASARAQLRSREESKKEPNEDGRPILVMTVLALEEAATIRLSTAAAAGRAIKLVGRGQFARRSLLLPSGVVYQEFPTHVSKCLRLPSDVKAGCISTLLDGMARRIERKKRAVRPQRPIPTGPPNKRGSKAAKPKRPRHSARPRR